MTRLVAVLGYSDGKPPLDDLHPVCAARLARARAVSRPDDAVLFSGWARHRGAQAEADLMARSWDAPARLRVADRGARTTLGNAIAVGRAAREVGAAEVVLVTSGWHGRRAGALTRAALLGTEATLRVVTTDERATTARRLRELAAWTALPVLALVAARTR